ncbi:MAG TPA: ABC transporter substrate-binding protein [Halococcus sp.]|nr:ABC transporter substrate-binding protein [Halococcus sp.]
MDTRELPVLTDEESDLIARLAVGLGTDAARVLAYLLCRRETDFESEPATRLAVRIGTSLNRETAATALNELEEEGLIAATTVRNDTRGRPPTAWYAPENTETTVRKVDGRHAAALLEQAKAVATELGVDSFEESANPCEDSATSEPLRLGLNWSPNALHAPFFAAVSTDQYEKRGVEVAIDHYRGSGRALDSLVSEATDVALAGAATTIRRRDAGEPILPIALLFQRAMAVLYTTRDAFGGRFESIEQLRDRRVGMSGTSETGLLGRLFLSQAGVLDDVTVIDLTGEEQAALRSGRAAVVTGSFSDPRQLETEGHTVDSLLVADQFPMYGPALVITERTLRERQPALERFLAGTVAGWAETIEHPEAAVRAVGAGESVGEHRVFERAVERFATGSAVEKHGWGWHRAAGWERLVTALGQADLLEETETP